MSRRLLAVPGLLGLALLLPCPALACSLCGSAASQLTLRQEMDQARMVLYGSISNPRLGNDGAPGSGTCDFQILKVLKYDPFLGEKKVIQLNRYLPVLDPRDPPKFIVFCEIISGKIDPYRGRAVKSNAVLPYLEGAKAQQGKDRTQALLYYFRFLDHEDDTIAGDAFLEFARSTDQEVGEVGRRLAPEQLRRLLQDPKTPPGRLGLYAFMLGACGGDRDAEVLRAMIQQPTERTANALDGLLSGYIHLRPAAGWELAVSILGDKRRPFPERFAAARTLRFYHSWKPAETRPQVLRGLSVMVGDGDVADLAIEDLRRWQMWDLTGKVLAQYGKESHKAPLIQRTIGRYALTCPLPEARQFAQQLRRHDPELVRDLEEALSFEQQR
jgi:hypothetical protein